jgi:hypothetical protein
MADDRKAFQCPIGTAHFPSLTKTETYKGKDTGNYTLKLKLSGEALAQVKAEVEEFLVDTYGPKKAKTVASPFKLTKPRDGGEPETFIVFRAKAVINDKERKVAIFDAKGKPVDREVNLGSDSVVKVNGYMSAFQDKPGVRSTWTASRS